MTNITAPAEVASHALGITQPDNIGKRDHRYWTPEDIIRLRRMRCVDGCSFAEIAEALGRSKKSVMAKAGVARLKLPRDKYLEIKRAVARRNSLPSGSPFADAWDDGDAA